MPFLLKKRQTLRIGGTPSGMRAYLCVAGGFQAQEVLGSVSSLEPLQAPMDLMCTSGQFPLRSIHGPFLWNQAERTLHVVQGAQADWFPEGCLMGQEFAVTPAGNRMGLRLQGAPLPVPNRELVSEPVSPGAVQVTREGQCIVLGVDGQTIGGYPKIAHVISADLDKLGQLRPGEIIRFQHVSLPEAEALFKRKQAELREWLMRLQIAEGIRGNSSEALKGRDIEAQGKR